MSKRLLGMGTVALILSACAIAPLTAQRGGAAQPNLPDGEGKQMVQTLCAGCHSLNNITQGWGYDKQGWDEVIASMVALDGS